jgi:hypothetical protein
MTVLDRPNTPPVAIQRSPRSAPARNAKVRSNSDASPRDTPLTTQNKPEFHSAAGVRAPATVTLRPSGSLTSHLAPIEIP